MDWSGSSELVLMNCDSSPYERDSLTPAPGLGLVNPCVGMRVSQVKVAPWTAHLVRSECTRGLPVTVLPSVAGRESRWRGGIANHHKRVTRLQAPHVTVTRSVGGRGGTSPDCPPRPPPHLFLLAEANECLPGAVC